MSNNSDEKITRGERRRMLKRQQQMKTFGLMIIGVLIIIAAFVLISLIQPDVTAGVSDKDYSLENGNGFGDPNAPVVLEVYSSFACIHCMNFSEEAEQAIIENYVKSGQVYFVYRSFNGNPDDAAGIAGQAAYCAGDQGSFWAMHDTIFANYNGTGYTPSQLASFANALELDTTEFSSCMTSGKYADTVLADFQKGYDLGITGTPSFTINGQVVFRGNVPYEQFEAVIEEALAAQN